MTRQEQLAMLHIGIIIKQFIPKDVLPDDLNYVADVLLKHLNLDISKCDNILSIRDKVVNAYVDAFGDISKPTDTLDAFDRAMRGI